MPQEVVSLLAEKRLISGALPREAGGLGLSAIEFGHLCEEFGYVSSSLLALITVHTMVSMTVLRWASEANRQRWLPQLAAGTTIGAFALSEPDVGSDAKSVQTEVQLCGDTLRLSGRKRWISFGQLAGLYMVVAKYNGRSIGVLVPRDTPGLTVVPIRDMLCFRAAMLAELQFDDCRLPADSLVCNTDFSLSQFVGSALDHGRYCIGWGAAGLARACLEASLRYADTRIQFGKPLREHPPVQAMLADMLVQTTAAHLLCEEAARQRETAAPDSISTTLMAKYFASGVAARAAADAVQVHGANGCSADYSVQRYFRDAKAFELIEGSSQILQMVLAQHAYQRQDSA